MIEAEALPPHRVLLICCDTAMPQALHQLLEHTRYWEAGLDVAYGELLLRTVALQEVPHVSSERSVGPLLVGCFDVLQCSLRREQYQWTLSAIDLAALLELAGQQDWIVFVNDAPPDSELAMLQLMLAEKLRDFLLASAEDPVDIAVSASANLPAAKPVFIQCQPDSSPKDWPAFYQQLDSNSRWQQFVHCRWRMVYPDGKAKHQVDADIQPWFWLAEQLYLLLLGSTASDIGPRLDELAPAKLVTQGIAAEPRPVGKLLKVGEPWQVGAQWLDWRVLVADELLVETDSFKVSFAIQPAQDYSADNRLTSLSVWQGSVLDSGPDMNCWPRSHHQFSHVRICLKQIPVDLSKRHLLLIQRQQPRPLWQLLGYWRLRLV